MTGISDILGYLARGLSFDQSHPLLFTQFFFWAFFAMVFAVFSLIHNRKLLRNTFLFFVSLFFYYKTSGLFVLLLIFVTFSDWFIAQRVHKRRGTAVGKIWLILSLVIDLSILCYFKYAYFFSDVIHNLFGIEIAVRDVLGQAGNALVGANLFSVDKIILPVGISFYIFQVISYEMDVYRGQVEPVRNILDFGFYVSFFPQLVAGPIVRAKDFIPQLYKPFHLGRKQFGIAVFWILNGLTKKIILSDYIAVNFIDRVFENPLLFSGFENLCALFGYSLQVYADFSGYTDIAIGVAMLMGFYLPQNFNSPYKATNPQGFWRRWHMSLSNWLKNYLYIPLGGNRNATFGTFFWIFLFGAIALILSGSLWATAAIVGVAGGVLLIAAFKPERRKKIIANVNSFITMLLGGLWHGASANFLIWGGLNGVGIIVYKTWKDMKWSVRMLVVTAVTAAVFVMGHFRPSPLLNILKIWTAVICVATWIRAIYNMAGGVGQWKKLGTVWAIAQTFTFITFTRLFFRSGSNLDPATANAKAWETATSMIHQIGSHWNTSIIPDVVVAYWKVFALIIAGMIIHWLPDHFKRWYRINFAMLPIPVIMLAVVAVVFVLYQFVTAGFQPFIYFQF